ncbi:MAG: YhfC family glutamic-type intramembrane protease [Chloroflexota bacterium]|nr:YhfC family glutamic-type intramembrane protease [Chloroflexota bacterium]
MIIAIVIALLISIVLHIAAGYWLNKQFSVAWRVISYGALAYLIVQALLVLLFNGFTALVENGTWVLSAQESRVTQIALSVLLGALLGALIRWIGMKFLNEKLDTLEAAYGIGVGYGGVESVLMVGLPLLSTFITMLNNMNIYPATTSLDPSIVTQIEEIWQVSALIPLA